MTWITPGAHDIDEFKEFGKERQNILKDIETIKKSKLTKIN